MTERVKVKTRKQPKVLTNFRFAKSMIAELDQFATEHFGGNRTAALEFLFAWGVKTLTDKGLEEITTENVVIYSEQGSES